MDAEGFTRELQREGFGAITTVTREPDGILDIHTHAFEAKALILSGEIRIRCTGQDEALYRLGDIFHLAHGQPHSESYGPEGVSYLVGRK